MNRIDEKYLTLLRAALWGGNELTSEGLTSGRVNEVIRLAALQGTGPLVYDQLLKMQDLKLSAELRMQMKQQCLQSIMLQKTMFDILAKSKETLAKINIHPVLLKGFGLAQYYPQPHLRMWGDIDLYVGQKNYHKACSALRAVFPDTPHNAVEGEDYKHYNLDFPNTALEIHRISMAFHHPKDRRYYEHLENKYLTKDGPTFDLEGLKITTPEETFNLFFVFLHAWHHFEGTGMNMKQLCDIAMLLHAKRKAIKIEKLHEMLRKLCLLEVWQLLMYIMVHYLGVSQEECPFYTDACKERADLLFERIMKEGSARKHEPVKVANVSYLKRKWITFQSRMADSRFVKPYAPRYARHMVISDVLHGIERTIKGK